MDFLVWLSYKVASNGMCGVPPWLLKHLRTRWSKMDCAVSPPLTSTSSWACSYFGLPEGKHLARTKSIEKSLIKSAAALENPPTPNPSPSETTPSPPPPPPKISPPISIWKNCWSLLSSYVKRKFGRKIFLKKRFSRKWPVNLFVDFSLQVPDMNT